MQEQVKRTMESLEKNNIKARFFESSAEAVSYILDSIKAEDRVGIGGSMTVKSLNIPEKLIERGNKVYFHWLESTPEKMDEARRNAAVADVYLTSTNALTEDGQLINTDGVGNRVSAMIFGPKKVIVVCGINKLVKNLDAGLQRIKDNAYKNARRLKLNTPCAINEKCSDCSSPQRMCSVTTIINKKPQKTEIEVVIIGEELGY